MADDAAACECSCLGCRQQLEQLRDQLDQAGQLGLQLLNENNELKLQAEDVGRDTSSRIQELEAELALSRERLQHKEQLINEYDRGLLKAELQQAQEKQALEDELRRGHEIKIDAIRQQLRKAETDLLELQSTLSQREAEVEQLRYEAQMARPLDVSAFSDHTADDCKLELARVTMERDQLSEELMERDNELLARANQITELREEVRALQQHVEGLTEEKQALKEEAEAQRQRREEAEKELHEQSASDKTHKKGNSMFHELDDQRRRAEEEFLSLKKEAVTAKEDKKRLLTILAKTRNELAMAQCQRMPSVSEPIACTKREHEFLRTTLDQKSREVAALDRELQTMRTAPCNPNTLKELAKLADLTPIVKGQLHRAVDEARQFREQAVRQRSELNQIKNVDMARLQYEVDKLRKAVDDRTRELVLIAEQARKKQDTCSGKQQQQAAESRSAEQQPKPKTQRTGPVVEVIFTPEEMQQMGYGKTPAADKDGQAQTRSPLASLTLNNDADVNATSTGSSVAASDDSKVDGARTNSANRRRVQMADTVVHYDALGGSENAPTASGDECKPKLTKQRGEGGPLAHIRGRRANVVAERV